MRGAAVVGFVATCLPGQRALLDTLPQDARVGEHSYLGFGAELDAWELPGDGLVLGFAKIGERLWIARGGKLHCVEWPSRRELRTTDAPAELASLCADERFVYGVADRTLHVLDPIAGTSMRTVAIDTVWPPSAIAMHRGKLHALVDKSVLTVDLATGAVQQLMQMPERAHWIAGDGARLWLGDSAGCRPFTGDASPDSTGDHGRATGTWAGRTWPYQVGESAATWIDGRLLVALEVAHTRPPIREAGMLAPIGGLLGDRIVLAIGIEKGAVACALDYEPVADQELAAALRRRAKAPLRDRVMGNAPPQPAIVIDAEPGVKVRDVARVWDLAIAAGFASVHCPPLEGWVLRQQREAKTAPNPAPEPKK